MARCHVAYLFISEMLDERGSPALLVGDVLNNALDGLP